SRAPTEIAPSGTMTGREIFGARGPAATCRSRRDIDRKQRISTTEIAPPQAETQEDQLALEQRLYEESLKVLDEGQVLTGVIVAKYQEELLVDIGGKSEGTLPFRELSLAIDPKTLKVGDKLEVMIHRIDEDGELLLSERRA